MKLVLIFVGVLLVLAAGGGTAWWLVTSADPQGDMREAGLLSSTPQFLALDALDIPIIEDGAVVDRIAFALTLDLAPGADPRALKKQMPRIRDALFAELHALFAMRAVKRQDNPLPLIKQRLREVADRTLGGGIVAEVLITNVSKRRLSELTASDGASRGRRVLPKPHTER